MELPSGQTHHRLPGHAREPENDSRLEYGFHAILLRCVKWELDELR
jgi:hypothetical protein